MKRFDLLKVTVMVLAVAWFALTVLAALCYPGSKLLYAVFSIAFTVMLGCGLYKQDSYGYMFLTIFLWLGFWLKLTVHTISGAKYIEPIGTFIPTPANLDGVLIIAVLAALGVISARGLWSSLTVWGVFRVNMKDSCPSWYPRYRKWLWALMLGFILFIPGINTALGINQVGLVPRTILHWPLNFLIIWFLWIGLPLGIVTLLWWDISAKKGVFLGLFSIFLEAAISSISLLSRATFVWHVFPVAVTMLFNLKELCPNGSVRRILLVGALAAMGFAVSFSVVNAMRRHYFSSDFVFNLSLQGGVPHGTVLTVTGLSEEFSQFYQSASKMVVDRWIGVEGVMAVSAYPLKGRKTFWAGITEKRETKKADFYQSVCQSGAVDNVYFQFGSLPGLTAFFYYSGSHGVVFLGVLVTALLVKFSEDLVGYLSGNPFVCAVCGVAVANTAVQLSAPRQAVPYFLGLICALTFMWFLRRDFCAGKTRF